MENIFTLFLLAPPGNDYYEYYSNVSTHRVVAVVTDVVSTDKKADHLPVWFKIDSLYKKEEDVRECEYVVVLKGTFF